MITVREMLKKFLKTVGADGLYNDCLQCGCGFKEGLCPCDCVVLDECVAAKWQDCKDCPDYEDCMLRMEAPDIDGCFRPIVHKRRFKL